VALPTVLQYLFPNYVKGYMYTIAGFDVYGTWVMVGIISSIIITIINYFGVKTAAFLQGLCTVLITLVGLALIGGSFVNGSTSNIQPLFNDGVGGFMAVAVMTPHVCWFRCNSTSSRRNEYTI